MEDKFKIHKSIEERSKSHRNTHRNIGWGAGVTEGVAFSKKMLLPSFWGTWTGFGLLWLIVNLLPYSCITTLGRFVGRQMKRFIKGRRYIVQTNLKLSFPDKDQQWLDDMEHRIFESAGIAIFETGIAWFWPNWRIKRLLIVDEKELERARELAKADTRTIAFTCHMTTLEIGARLYALAIKPGIGVYRSSDHPVIEYIQVKGRLRSNLALVDRNDVRSMVKAVMKGYPIWYAPDQDYGTNSAVFVPFFAVDQAATVTGLHDLARIKGVKVQPFWLIREKNGYRLRVLDPIENFPTQDEVADTRLGNEYVEKMILSAPEQYLWMHRRFKTCPEGVPSRYPKIE